MAALAFVDGWPALVLAGIVAAMIFGQVTVNETMTARYISPPLRTKMYSIRFFVGFLGSAGAAPLVGILHERTGELFAVTLVLAAVTVITVAARQPPYRPCGGTILATSRKAFSAASTRCGHVERGCMDAPSDARRF